MNNCSLLNCSQFKYKSLYELIAFNNDNARMSKGNNHDENACNREFV